MFAQRTYLAFAWQGQYVGGRMLPTKSLLKTKSFFMCLNWQNR